MEICSILNPGAGSTSKASSRRLAQYDNLQVGEFAAGETIQIDVGGPLAFGNSFDIIDFASFSDDGYEFNFSSALPNGLQWDTSAFATTGMIRVGYSGDFNYDDVVGAADYVVWRKTDGTPAGYNAWRTHFGQTAGNGSVPWRTPPSPSRRRWYEGRIVSLKTR